MEKRRRSTRGQARALQVGFVDERMSTEAVCAVVVVPIWVFVKIIVFVSMARTKMTRSGKDTCAETGDRPGRRSQTTSYKNQKELGLKADDLNEGSAAHASHVQGRELSVYKTLVSQVESSSLDSNEKDREQGVEVKDSTEQESEEYNEE
ncbi:hypothetical protein Syun_021260 [Stephania yunnanensis]|uniref:Uncharacterized protein n=1 Tax=Stephania yunnanensis TaxID=152371 RepID=A0AAP0IFG8_9MAGN